MIPEKVEALAKDYEKMMDGADIERGELEEMRATILNLKSMLASVMALLVYHNIEQDKTIKELLAIHCL